MCGVSWLVSFGLDFSCFVLVKIYVGFVLAMVLDN